MLKVAFGLEVRKEFFFAESTFLTSSGAVVCRVWPFAVAVWNWVMFPVRRVFIAVTFVMPPLTTVSTLAFVFLTRLLSAGLESSLLLIAAIFLGISFKQAGQVHPSCVARQGETSLDRVCSCH